MLIKSTHPFLSSSQDVIEICYPIRQLGITYFSYTKSEKNGARTYLTTHPQVLEHYLLKEYFLIGNVESVPQKYVEQIIFWDTLPKQHIYDDNARSRNIDHGIFMINPLEDGCCEFFGFATKKGNNKIINVYLNNVEFLKKFTLYFKERAKKLISKATDNNLILPFHNDSLDFVKSSDLTLNQDLSTLLSPRQLQCATYLIEGKKIKEIAKFINLSPRTIEYYLNILKLKFRCKNKTELLLILSQILKIN